MASKLDISGIDDIIRRFEQTVKKVKDKDGVSFDPKQTRTFVRGGPYLHTGPDQEENAKKAAKDPEEFAYWREFFQGLEDVW